MNSKINGSFYTPEDIAFWMSNECLGGFPSNKEIRILEPSSGAGIFIKALLSIDANYHSIDAVEYDVEAFNKSNAFRNKKINIFNDDFLFWEKRKKYDLILGNPPYIMKKSLSNEQAEKSKLIHIKAGLKNREISNIWTPFVIKSAEILTEDGILGFVLPTELLQVNYAKEIREFLLEKFQRVEVISFKSLAFENLEQDTVILLAYKKPTRRKGLYFAEVTSVDELTTKKIKYEKHHGDKEAKWSSYILTEGEIAFIKNISEKCSKVSDLCTSVAGIVTAANDYFILSKDEVEQYNLEKYVKKIIKKGLYVNGSAELAEEDYLRLKDEDRPCYLLDLNEFSDEKFTDGLKDYLNYGVSLKIPDRYKCKLRKRWFDVPSVWKSEGFFFKRSHLYPKLLVNKADVHVTDSAYRIRMNDGGCIESFTASFYNSLTLLCSELGGRYYGGGVLEITPNEFKGLPIPHKKHSKKSYKKFIVEFNKKSSIEDFLMENDKLILSSIDGIKDGDIETLQFLYRKVKRRRLRG